MERNKKVVLGITGSIAIYKACDLCRRLRERKIEVSCILTAAAQRFISPLVFQTLSQNKVYTDIFDNRTWEMEHISLAQDSDLILIAPATAEIISRLSNGRANDLLTATVLSATCPVLIAPAMNKNMYLHPLTQKNIQILKSIGYQFIEPEEGSLACGEEGVGRLASLEKILAEVNKHLSNDRLVLSNNLKGRKILITAGPTREYWDPVRFISNGSSGQMGYTLAEVALNRGAEVVLISGPTNLCPPSGVKTIFVDSAGQMQQEVEKHFPSSDVVIATAAVADYRPIKVNPTKLKKQKNEIALKLIRNPDILAQLGRKKGKKKLIGFALETEDIEKNARKKLAEKKLDLIIANGPEAIGENEVKDVIIISKKDKEFIPLITKRHLAEKILNKIV